MPGLLRGFALVALFLLPAYAHWADLAAAEVTVQESAVNVVLTYATGLTAFADDNKNSKLSAREIKAHQKQLEAFFADKIRLNSAVRSLEVAPAESEVSLPSLGPSARVHSTVLLTYRWEKPITRLKINYSLFLPGVSTASCVATILVGGKVYEVVFTPTQQEFVLGQEQAPVDFLGFLELGINHILSGFDHLLFLISLLMLGGGLRYLLKVITAFTLAHSITLSLTALGLLSLPGRFIESGIALSIAYVAAENLFRKDTSKLLRSRWAVTFFFGLIHGMGFADILREMGLPKDNLLGSLVGFNLGVEVGQLAVVIPVFLLLLLLKRLPWEGWVRRAVSVGAVAVGLIWFVQRAFLAA